MLYEVITIFNVSGTNLIHKVGESIGSIYDYEFDGIWQLDEAAEAAKYGQTPGQVRVKDLNNDGAITPEKDRKVIGQVTPKWTGGISSNMEYKDFDFSFSLVMSYGNKMFVITSYSIHYTKLYELNRWQCFIYRFVSRITFRRSCQVNGTFRKDNSRLGMTNLMHCIESCLCQQQGIGVCQANIFCR